MNTQDLIPYEAIHAGEYIFDEMEARKMTQRKLAKDLGISAPYLNEIIKGKKDLNADLAFKLEKVWGTPAHMGLGLQVKYELDLVRIKYRDVEFPLAI